MTECVSYPLYVWEVPIHPTWLKFYRYNSAENYTLYEGYKPDEPWYLTRDEFSYYLINTGWIYYGPIDISTKIDTVIFDAEVDKEKRINLQEKYPLHEISSIMENLFSIIMMSELE